MRLLLLLTLFFGGLAVDFHPPRENQFQIQGVSIEERPHYHRRHKRQFPQQFYRQGVDKDTEQDLPLEKVDEDPQSPAYLERPAVTSFTQTFNQPAQSFGQSASTFQQQTFRPQPLPTSQPQQTYLHGPAPQQQFQPQQVPQQQFQPQTAVSPAQTWPNKQRIFNDVNNFGQPQYNVFNRQGGGGIEVDGYNGARYYYPPKQPFPLPKCFYNPSGYVCCNQHLNDLIVETYTELEKRPKFHTCNVNALAFHIQQRAERRFNHTFETIAAYDDFAQKIHFKTDFVCKVELGGKYMLAYATVREAMEQTLRPVYQRPLMAGPAPFHKNHHQMVI